MKRQEEFLGIDKRKAILTLVVGVVLVAGVVAIIGQVADFHKVTRAIRHAHRGWLLVCLVGEILAYTGYIAAYRDFARVDGGPRLPVWTATRVVAVGFGAYIVGSSAGTLGVDYWALHRAGDKPHTAARRVLALNTLEWGVLAVAATVAAIAMLAGSGDGAPLAMELAWIVVVPLCIAAALWVTSPKRVAKTTSLPERRVKLERSHRTWSPWLWNAAHIALADAIGGVVLVRHVLARPRRYPFAVLGFPLFWGGDILGMYAALRAFGVHIGLAPLILAYTTAYVVTSLPLPAGGAGGVEAGLIFSLKAVGVALAPALLATLVYRFFTLWLPLGVAALALTQVRALAEELPHVEHEPAPG
jgi:uncharacterized protein (TIRG00374 family)